VGGTPWAPNAPVARIQMGSATAADQMLTTEGVPHACHDVGITAVIGSH